MISCQALNFFIKNSKHVWPATISTAPSHGDKSCKTDAKKSLYSITVIHFCHRPCGAFLFMFSRLCANLLVKSVWDLPQYVCVVFNSSSSRGVNKEVSGSAPNTYWNDKNELWVRFNAAYCFQIPTH